MPSRGVRLAILVISLAAGVAVAARWVCGGSAKAYFDGELAAQEALARRVVRGLEEHRGGPFYPTKSARFSGQSAIATYQMAIMGLGQIAIAHPEKRSEYLPIMLQAADRLVDPRTLRYARSVYGEHGVVSMKPGEGHAYLGYINLALGILRELEPNNRHAVLHDRMTTRLAARLDASPTGMIETYPHESWPPDVAAVAGSIGLHARATGVDRSALLRRWASRFSACAMDESGYLVQRLKAGGCKPADAPRGSGTAIGSYFISFADVELSTRLYRSLRSEGFRSVLGFGGVREYATGFEGSGDVNAGPILLGVSVGATGYGLGAARVHGDRELFSALYRTTHLFGVPTVRGDETSFAMGGMLGNALLLAMLTAHPVDAQVSR